ncbi:MAG TPA: fibronectin type III domain-containing protein [Terriglobales bacterium]|nr:fibronectin type III domain-containing protein [Terriglobales bacterium]
MSSKKLSGICSLCAALLALACAAGCGLPGAPQPPSLELPKTVGDLRAARKGARVILTWTPPRQTTDRRSVRALGPTRICSVPGTSPMTTCQTIGEAPGGAPPGRNEQTQSEFVDTLPADLMASQPTGFVTYAVEVLNTRGRGAGLSNQVQAPTAPTAPPPERVSSAVIPEGVQISASGGEGLPRPSPGLTIEYHVFRKPEGGNVTVDLGAAIVNAELGRAYSLIFLDRNIEWEKTYTYHVAAVTTLTRDGTKIVVEGDDSPPVKVFAHDTFPPAAPSGVQAVFASAGAQRFIDLTWTPNTDADLAGYNVYRREEGGAAVRTNSELLKAPAFRDTNVVARGRYLYSVTAVDVRGNESEKSAEATESVPQQ